MYFIFIFVPLEDPIKGQGCTKFDLSWLTLGALKGQVNEKICGSKLDLCTFKGQFGGQGEGLACPYPSGQVAPDQRFPKWYGMLT